MRRPPIRLHPLLTAASLPSWSLALLLAAALPVAAQQPPAPRAVNPLTGMPLSLEDMHWSLEQAHLEEQLQASLLNRRKFELERHRLEQGDGQPAGVDGLVDGMPFAPGTPAIPAGGAPLPRFAALAPPVGASDAMAARPAAASAARPAPVRTARHRSALVRTWQVVGIRAHGSEWCLLVSEEDQLWPVCAGQSRHGHHVDNVTAQGYSVDGHAVMLDQPAGRLQGVESLAALPGDPDPGAKPTAAALATVAGPPPVEGSLAEPVPIGTLPVPTPTPALLPARAALSR